MTTVSVQWTLAYQGSGIALLKRYADSDGFGSDGKVAIWKEVARIPTWSDAADILQRLQGSR